MPPLFIAWGLNMIPLYVMIGPRNEEDIIYATVKHMITQGANRVFIFDGDSDDRTIEEAEEAGAEITDILKTDTYDEALRCKLMHSKMWELLTSDEHDKIWTMFLDADEFPMSPISNLTIREFLISLNPEYNAVGSYNYNHYPLDKPYYIRHFHPLDFQPWYQKFDARTWHCERDHWKHNCHLYEQGKHLPNCGGGFHDLTAEFTECTESLRIHHFPYREKKETFKRLKETSGRISRKTVSGIEQKFETLNEVYSQEWGKVNNLQSSPLILKKWNMDYYKRFRWYNSDNLEDALKGVAKQ